VGNAECADSQGCKKSTKFGEIQRKSAGIRAHQIWKSLNFEIEIQFFEKKNPNIWKNM
jgi:hypothetical protein